jgi:hypothetical protein
VTRQAGDKLGPYEILAPIGAGGMGEVYARRSRAGTDSRPRAYFSTKCDQSFSFSAQTFSKMSSLGSRI